MSVMKIQKWGNSQGIRIPKSILDAVKLKGEDKVEITTENDTIIIKKADEEKKRITLLFEGYQGQYQPTEIDWGRPQGKEVW